LPLVVLGVTGCIGAYKACEVLRELQKRDVDVRVVMTAHATRFVSAMTFEALSRHPVFVDGFELGEQSDIQHISLASSADLLLVAPATGNMLGKFANGIADDALSTLYLATTAPVLVAPAMNVEMFRHPAVLENMRRLRERGVGVVEPGSGYLACGWLGKGRLAEVPDIVYAALRVLQRRTDMKGETVVVTAGPTVEDIDPVRFVSNRSSGRMGYAMAEAARDRGAQVVLVSGPTSLPVPVGIEHLPVRSAQEMLTAVSARFETATILAMASAVSDYRPEAPARSKIKKSDGPIRLDLVRTPDVVATLAARKGDRLFVGFAAETEDVLGSARRKLKAKSLDLILANDVSRTDAGFAVETNAGILVDRTGREEEIALTTKREMADRIWDRALELKAATSAAPASRTRRSATVARRTPRRAR
jgi:phosphopantothenoylcysteine decarboxylase / phosphopantothenate---cysteine ligase